MSSHIKSDINSFIEIQNHPSSFWDMFEISDNYMLITAIRTIVWQFASFFCSSEELNISLPQLRARPLNPTWGLPSATACFHISFMCSGDNIKVESFVIKHASHLSIFVTFSCDISVLYIVIFKTIYDNKDDWRRSLGSGKINTC